VNARAILLGALLASVACGSAGATLTISAPPFFAGVMEYMDEQGIGDACLEMRVRAGKPSEIEVTRSSGDARLDAAATKGMRLEVDLMERFPLHWRKADAAGWRTIPLRFTSPDRDDTRVLGCAGKATGG
jgi:hypothetical protein